MANIPHPAARLPIDATLDAVPDAIAMAAGARLDRPHPLAEELRDVALSQLAIACAIRARKPQPYELDQSIIARGLSTFEFGLRLGDAVRVPIERRFIAQAAHRSFCQEIIVRDFKPVQPAVVDVDLVLPEVGELSEIANAPVFIAPSQQARLRTYAVRLPITREAVVNDDISIIATMLAVYGLAAARTESRLVYGVLETNATLPDGGPLFHADYGNVTAEALSDASLGVAMGLLRRQESAATEVDLAAAHLVVGASLEYSARKLVYDAGLDLSVTASADLPDGRWLLLADPAVAPVVGFLRLRGSRSPVMVEPVPRDDVGFDGAYLKARVDLGAAILGRVGVVRGGA